jgi:hypothetical protein
MMAMPGIDFSPRSQMTRAAIDGSRGGRFSLGQEKN